MFKYIDFEVQQPSVKDLVLLNETDDLEKPL